MASIRGRALCSASRSSLDAACACARAAPRRDLHHLHTLRRSPTPAGRLDPARPPTIQQRASSVPPRSPSSSPLNPPREFHTYFVTHLPCSSLHPDSSQPGPGHKLPRDASVPHTPSPGSGPAVAAVTLPNMPNRDLTVVRIPLRRAKHHFGAFSNRGRRAYNEDADQAGIIDMPAFAKRAPMSVRQKPGEPTAADSALGDPQIFYFAVFDGHGGAQCSQFLRDELHGYIEEAATEYGLQSSLRKKKPGRDGRTGHVVKQQQQQLDPGQRKQQDGASTGASSSSLSQSSPSSPSTAESASAATFRLEQGLVQEYRTTIGGYFRRFHPEHFGTARSHSEGDAAPAGIEAVLTYSFLRADLDFVTAQARKVDPDDKWLSDSPLNSDEILGVPHAPPSGHSIGGATRFKGGSTASVALISTPTAVPFWHPGAHSTLVVAHVGDSRVLLCQTATGLAVPLTSAHHPGTPQESSRLRKYAPAGSMVSGDSFGEERIAGLANSRAFGDVKSKRIGVSAEPEIARAELGPAQFSFLVLMSDGVSGTLSDQEIVDVVKEAKTPEEGARRVVEYATEVSDDGDNATCQVVRLGGWERRSEGGLGSLGTKEMRDMRRAEAQDPRRTHR